MNKKRDKQIKKDYKKGLGGKIGRRYGITRQRVFQIRHEKSHNGLRSSLVGCLMEKYKLIKARFINDGIG